MLVKKTIAYLPAQLLGPLAQFVSAIAWTHVLMPAEFGTFAIVWAVQELVHLVIMFWWSSYTLRYLTSYDSAADRARFDAVELPVLLLTGFLQGVVVALILAVVIDVDVSPVLAFVAIAFTVTRNLSNHVADRARARQEVAVWTVVQTIGPVLGLVLGFAAIWVGLAEASAATVLGAYALTQLLGLAAAFALHRLAARRGRVDREILAAAWRYGVPLVVSSALGWVGSHAIRFVVEHLDGAAAVGLVSVGWWLGQRAAVFASMLVTVPGYAVAIDRMRTDGPEAALETLATAGAMLIAVLLPTVIGLVILAGPLTDVLVGEVYREVTRAILPLAAATGALRAFRAHFADQCCLVFERPLLAVANAGVEAVLTVAGCIAGYWLMGGTGTGALVGAVAGALMAAVGATLYGLAQGALVFGQYLRLGDLARIIAASAGMAAVLVVLGRPDGFFTLLATILAAGVAYGLLIALLWPRSSLDLLRWGSARLTARVRRAPSA